MKERKISMEKLGDMLNYSKMGIHHYCVGDRIPKVDTAIQIARILGVKVEDIWEVE